MSSFEDLSFPRESFSGTARLFPLPNLVLFPHVMQPLHVFEARYRLLLEDALAGDRLMAMALLAPGWQKDYEGRPPLYPMACLARVTTYHRLEDGTYNLLILGLRRARLLRELQPLKSYREAEVELCEEGPPPEDGLLRGPLQRRLREALLRTLPMLQEAQEQMDQLLASDVPLGVLTDVLCFMLNVDVGRKQALLAETNVHRRAELLLTHMAGAAGGAFNPCLSGGFPPPFSAN
ncbi:MAG: LON peptidase substrate-binding domain-containing protein [Thermoguttaceae bacterium]|jgi:Lon protease-like protein